MIKPVVVCLCGSTRFMQAFQEANLRETLAGRIVLTVGCDTKSDAMLNLGDDVKAMLDELHKRKIDLADEVLVLNVGGYVGSSTASEIAYAEARGKRVRWLEPHQEEQPDFEPVNSNYHDDRCCCPVCSGLCQDDFEYYSRTGQYAAGREVQQ